MSRLTIKSDSINCMFSSWLHSGLFKLMVLLISTLQLTTTAANGLESHKANIDKLHVGYIIENKKVRDLYFFTVELYGYVNEVEILYDFPSNNALISIVADGAVSDGKLNESLVENLTEIDRQYLSKLDLSDLKKHNCIYIDNYADVQQSLDNAKNESSQNTLKTTLVIMDSKGWSDEAQLKCLFYGLLTSLGLEKKASIELIQTTPQNIVKQIINTSPFKDR